MLPALIRTKVLSLLLLSAFLLIYPVLLHEYAALGCGAGVYFPRNDVLCALAHQNCVSLSFRISEAPCAVIDGGIAR